MGSESSILKGCQWGESILSSDLNWNLQQIETKDGCKLTVFQPDENDARNRNLLHALSTNLKTLRHPSILPYCGAGNLPDSCFLATEQVHTLTSLLQSLHPLEISAGLHDILQALDFLHSKAYVAHNNLNLSAIFIASDGGWRLGELQYACSLHSEKSATLDACRADCNLDSTGLEDVEIGKLNGEGCAQDIFCLGVIFECLMGQLAKLAEYSGEFEHRVRLCLSKDVSLRPSAASLKNATIFQNEFVNVLNFVRRITLKTLDEKKEFFTGLLPRLLALPECVVAGRLVTPLLSRFVLLDEVAVMRLVPHLLTPKSGPGDGVTEYLGVSPVLSSDLFKQFIIPELLRIFQVHDSHIRLLLLRHLPRYVHLFDRDSLRTDVLPQILLGVRDSSDKMVQASLFALAELVPLLGREAAVGGPGQSYFSYGMPKFPTTVTTEKPPHSVSDIPRPDTRPGARVTADGPPLLIDLARTLLHRQGDVDCKSTLLENWDGREVQRRSEEMLERQWKDHFGGEIANKDTVSSTVPRVPFSDGGSPCHERDGTEVESDDGANDAGEHDADLTFQVHSEASADQEIRPIPNKGVVLQEDVSSISINVFSESRNPEVCDGMVDDLSTLTTNQCFLADTLDSDVASVPGCHIESNPRLSGMLDDLDARVVDGGHSDKCGTIGRGHSDLTSTCSRVANGCGKAMRLQPRHKVRNPELLFYPSLGGLENGLEMRDLKVGEADLFDNMAPDIEPFNTRLQRLPFDGSSVSDSAAMHDAGNVPCDVADGLDVTSTMDAEDTSGWADVDWDYDFLHQ